MKNKFCVFLFILCPLCGYPQTGNDPFSKYGYEVLVATSSKGEFDEFHDQSEIVEIGSVLYNTKTKKVVRFLEKDFSVVEVSSATVAMSIDPLCEKYYWISPYVYCANNPIKFVDPTGMFYTDYEIDNLGYIKRVGDIDDKPDRLFGTNRSTGEKESITVNDKTVLSNLSGKSNFQNKKFPESGKIVTSLNRETNKYERKTIYDMVDGHGAITSSQSEAKAVFEFSAKASDVEWGVSIYKNGEAIVGTLHENAQGPSFISLGEDYKFENQTYRAHSHSGNAPSVDFVPSSLDINGARKLIQVNPNAQNWLYVPQKTNNQWIKIR